MNKAFEWLRKEVEANSVECGGAKIISLHQVRILINRAENMLGSEREITHPKCISCENYAGEYLVPPICYLCCKGIEDNFKAKEEDSNENSGSKS